MYKRVAEFALTVLITAAFVVMFYESGLRDSLALRAGSTPVPVVYSTHEILSGSKVELHDLEVKEVAISHCPAGAINNPWIAVGRKSRWTLKPGEVVSFENFGLAEMIDKNEKRTQLLHVH